MTGLILVRQAAALGQVIDDLVLIVEASNAEEWEGKIVFLLSETQQFYPPFIFDVSRILETSKCPPSSKFAPGVALITSGMLLLGGTFTF